METGVVNGVEATKTNLLNIHIDMKRKKMVSVITIIFNALKIIHYVRIGIDEAL